MSTTNKNIISSFNVQEELNPDIWYYDGESYKMKPKIRVSLLDIVKDYTDFIDVELDIDDVTLTGSLANFNWSEFSDVDLHILTDFEGKDELLKKYLDSRRIIWNSLRSVTTKGFDVEIYVQDNNEPHFASGVYSVLYNEWIVEPKQEEVTIDSKKILSKAKNWMSQIDKIETNSKRVDPEEVLKDIDRFKSKIKKYRGGGLKDKGEYSYENLTFKFLRRNEYLKKLNDVRNSLIDKNLTLDENVSTT
jgi:predicted nucleotidyltransferase|tara:strand:- start:187 stop:930 length:744 start_codon:yes stop_codon:yes gene_type:complete